MKEGGGERRAGLGKGEKGQRSGADVLNAVRITHSLRLEWPFV